MANPDTALLLDLLLDLKKDMNDVKEVLTKNTVTLDTHERRSTASEDRLDRLEKKEQMVMGFIKITAGLATLGLTVLGIVEAIRPFLGK